MKNIECSDERGVEDNRSIIERISRWYKELENIGKNNISLWCNL